MPSQDRVAAELQDRYRIESVLGRGGTAVVYRASDLLLERPVAIKVLRATPTTDQDGLGRLLREAHTVAKLQHPNIVQLYDARALDDDGLALIMQYVAGPTLKEMIVQYGAVDCNLAGRILVDVARALAYAHGQKIVHRDVKPENVHFDQDTGVTLLSDFGIARRWGGASTLTLPGSALGTPAYMSPEQIDGRELDGRSDLYSLALVGYELLIGESPWKGDTLFSILEEQKRRIPPSVTELREDVPGHLAEAIGVALRKDPAQRWPDADAFIQRVLSAPLPDSPPPFRKGHAPEAMEEALTVLFRRRGDRPGALDEDAPPATAPHPDAGGSRGSERAPDRDVSADEPAPSTPGPPAGPARPGGPPQAPAPTRPGARVPDREPVLGFSLPPPPPGEGRPIPEGTEYYSREDPADHPVDRSTIVVETEVDFARVVRFDLYQIWMDGDLTFSHGDCGGGEMTLDPPPFHRTRRGKLKRSEMDPGDHVALVCTSCDRRLEGMTRMHFEEAVVRFLSRPYPSALEAYRLTDTTSLVAPGWKPPRRRRRPDRRAPETRYDVDPSLMGRRRSGRDRRRHPGVLDVPLEDRESARE